MTCILTHPAVLQIAIMQWLLCPALFVVGCWAAAASPQRFAALLPKPRYSWALAGSASAGKQAHTVLDSLPRSMHAAWQLGRLAAQLEGADPGSAGGGGMGIGRIEDSSNVLAAAAALLGVPAARLSPEQLLQLGSQLQACATLSGVCGILAGG